MYGVAPPTLHEVEHVSTKKWQNESMTDKIISLSLDDTGVSQQTAFISGPPLHQLSEHIFEILQDLTVAEIKWQHTRTHTHRHTN